MSAKKIEGQSLVARRCACIVTTVVAGEHRSTREKNFLQWNYQVVTFKILGTRQMANFGFGFCFFVFLLFGFWNVCFYMTR